MSDLELISPPLLDLFKTIVDADLEHILFINPAKSAKSKQTASFACTEYGAYWLKGTKKSKMKITLSCRWFDTTVINLMNDHKIRFTFAPSKDDEPIKGTYSGKSASRLYSLLQDHFRKISDPNFLPEFQKSGVRDPLPSKPTLYDPLLRFILVSVWSNDLQADDLRGSSALKKSQRHRFPSKSKTKIFRKFLDSKDPKLPLLLIPDSTETVLKSLCLIPWVKTLLIPADLTKKDRKLLIQWLADQTWITRLEFVGGPPDLAALHPTLAARTARGDNPITSLCCAGLPLDSRHFAALERIIDGQITQLTLSQSLHGDLSSRFLSALNTARSQQITHLNIDGASGVDFARLLDALPNLQVLSLAGCSLELAALFQDLLERPAKPFMAFLTALNVSENLCRRPFPSAFAIPDRLASVRADRIEWAGENLAVFYAAVLAGRPDPIAASFSGAVMDAQGWAHFWRSLDRISSDLLVSLAWEDNPVAPGLFEFLRRSRQLMILSVAGSLTSGDPNLSLFGKFLRETVSLREVDFSRARSGGVLAANELESLFTAVQENRSLSRVFCCRQAAGPGLLRFVGNVLMANRRVTVVRLDANDFDDYQAFVDVFNMWKKRGVPLAYEWPQADLDVIAGRDPAAKKGFKALRKLHRKIVKGNPKISVPPASVERAKLAQSFAALAKRRNSTVKPPPAAIALGRPDSQPDGGAAAKRRNSSAKVQGSVSDVPRPESRAGGLLAAPQRGEQFPKFQGRATPTPAVKTQAWRLQQPLPGRLPQEYTVVVPARYVVKGGGVGIEERLAFSDVDPIAEREDGEWLLPLPVLPPLDNGFVPEILEEEFNLGELMRDARQSKT